MIVIVHAGDLGICSGINDRIKETHLHGCVQRNNIIANGAAFDQAIGLLRDYPSLAWSVHLNLVEGQCISPKETISLLVDARGRFKQRFCFILVRRCETTFWCGRTAGRSVGSISLLIVPGRFKSCCQRSSLTTSTRRGRDTRSC